MHKFSANYNRLFRSINKIKPGKITSKIEALFGLIPPKILLPFKDIEMEFMNKNLNGDQRDAVKLCVEQPYLAAIHGPPGCGKTTTLVETILQLCIRGQKVLCAAPSNAAVDNIATTLLASKFIPQVYLNKKERKRNKAKKTPDVVRLVAPQREISEIIKEITLNAKIRQNENYDTLAQLELQVKDYEMRLREEHARIGGFEVDKESEMEVRHRSIRTKWMQECNRLRKLVLEQADVVVTTLAGAHDEGMLQYVDKDHFDVVVIDEASQATEPQSWLGIHNARKVILAGDHKQLPPFVNSMLAVSGGLEESILERVSKMVNGGYVKLLSQQYRMNTKIMEWPSTMFYQAKLHCDDEVGSRVLNDLVDNEDCIFSSNPLFLVDHAGMDYEEETSNSVPMKGKESKDQMSLESRYETKGDCSSIYNRHEAYLVSEYCCMLVKELGYEEDTIAIISPYAAQVKHIDQMLYGREIYGVEVRTVDSFQGREKETVLFSMTRSNQNGNIGFLSDSRRLNVAITRARRHVAVFCDTKTVCTDKIVRSLVTQCINRGHVIKVEHCNRYEMQSNISYFSSGLQIGLDQDLNNEINEISTKKSLRFDVAVEELLRKFSRRIELNATHLKYHVSGDKLTFSSEYSRQFRHIVHYFAEKFNLRHKSRDLPDCYREIVVKRKKRHSSSDGNGKRDKTADEGVIVAGCEKPNEKSAHNDNTNSLLKNKSQREIEVSPTDDSLRANNLQASEASKQFLDDEIKGTVEKTDTLSLNIEKFSLSCNETNAIEKDESSSFGTLLNPFAMLQNKEEPAVETEETNSKNKKKRKKKKKNKNVTEIKVTPPNIEKNDDELLEQAAMDQSKCPVSKCSVSVAMVGQCCQLCNMKFCFKHLLPEVHGCGELAKVKSRGNHLKKHVSSTSSANSQSRTAENRRGLLRHQLDKKIDMKKVDRKKRKNKK